MSELSFTESQRTFLGKYYHLNWMHEERPCLYVGNSQGGPDVPGVTDSVIAETSEDHIVSGPLSEDGYRYGLFDSELCSTLQAPHHCLIPTDAVTMIVNDS